MPKTTESSPHDKTQEELRLKADQLPRHVAIIMDGNGRWARQRGFTDRIRGHEAGIEAVRDITRACAAQGIKVLTLYAFSKENWSRPRSEITALMHLLKHFLVSEREELMRNNVRLVASGDLDDLPHYARSALDKTMELTANNSGMILNLALSYSGRAEILNAVKRLMEKSAKGQLRPEELTADEFSRYLFHPELGDPDLMIRTSGEHRISNFLLWQVAYTEIYVTPVLWPDFRRRHLFEALLDYQSRERRFGRVT